MDNSGRPIYMFINDRPWTTKGPQLLDAYGTLLATFEDAANADYCAECVKKNEAALAKIEELQQKLDELEQLIPDN